jgi:hypothetical protein
MDTYFDEYNKYLNFLLKVECSKQDLDYDETLKRIISNQANESEKKGPLKVTAKVAEPDKDGISIVSIFASGGQAPYTGIGDFEVQPGIHAFAIADSNNQKKFISITADFPVIEDKKPEETDLPQPSLLSSPLLLTNHYDLEFEDSYYIGETLDGLMHGFGARYWNSGKKWEGDWLYGKANGQIIVSFDDVVTYDGNMMNDLPNDKGTYTDPETGRTYIGNWIDFRREGEGKLLSGEGEKIYEGEWLNDKYHGYGQSFLRGICRYEGNWENGLRSGEGIAYDEDGNVEYQGLWSKNEKVN